MNQHFRIAQLLKTQPLSQTVEIRGWVRTRRDSKGFSFLEVNDGSCVANLQVIAEESLPHYEEEILRLTTGCSVRISGLLAASPAKGQAVELKGAEVEVYGWADPETYPLQKKRHSFEFLREIGHLRPRTNSLGAVARVRSALSFAVHRFFQEQGFQYIHTPIITTSDCEGAGEMFTVTTLDLNNIPRKDDRPDFGKDFFGRQASLTVSGQLEAEIYCLALGSVYTFGPTFRAEKSKTRKHLMEFWMVEPEIAFAELNDIMDLSEDFITHIVSRVLENRQEELKVLERDTTLLEKIKKPFPRISYSEICDSFEKWGHQFKRGADLGAPEEAVIGQKFDKPVMIHRFPMAVKAFYMKPDPAAPEFALCVDVIAPEGYGEIIGGGQREDNLAHLTQRINEQKLPISSFEWYLDLRRYGSVPHGGFGLGVERTVSWLCGSEHIRECIPFPRMVNRLKP